MGRAVGAEWGESFERFVAARRSDLVRTAAALLGRTGPDAEDLVQSSLIRAAARWDAIDDPYPYVRRVMVRLAIDDSRRQKRRPRELPLDSLGDYIGLSRESGDPADEVATADQVWRLLAVLSARQRHVLVLRYLMDCTEVDTARLLRCSLATVKSESHRALRHLRDLNLQSETRRTL